MAASSSLRISLATMSSSLGASRSDAEAAAELSSPLALPSRSSMPARESAAATRRVERSSAATSSEASLEES